MTERLLKSESDSQRKLFVTFLQNFLFTFHMKAMEAEEGRGRPIFFGGNDIVTVDGGVTMFMGFYGIKCVTFYS